MPVFELYNADGTLQFNLAGRVPRILGAISISAAGSLSHPAFSTGELFYTLSLGSTTNRISAMPSVSLSGITLSWTASPNPMLLTYGVY